MEAAGLASSIITFIEFSYKIINGTVAVYRKTATGPAADPHISNVIEDLEDATKAMKIKGTASSAQTVPHQRQLLMLADNCNELSKELIASLKDLERKTDGSKLWRSLQASWKTLRKSGDIAEMEQKLNTYRLQLVLRLSLMLSDDAASVKAQLDQIHRGNVESFGETIAELQSVRKLMKELDTRLDVQANQACHSPTMDAEQIDGLADIRGALSRITQTLETIPRRAPADLQIIARLRFETLHARVDSISEGDFRVFTSLLENSGPVSVQKDLTVADRPAERPLKHAQSALNYWLELEDKVLHISGKAGSGKSTLMKALSQDTKLNDKLRAWAGGMKLVVARFFFWIAGDPIQNSLEGLYRSVLLEILQQCPELTRVVFPEHWNEISTYEGFVSPERFSFRLFELQDAMARLVKGVSDRSNYRFCFFIDGLDEYAGESMDHLKLAKQLRQWARFPYVKICTSSRPHEEFHSIFDECARIDLHKLTGPDILRYSREELNSVDNSHLASEQVEDLADNIRFRAEGVFLWARLVVHSLCKGILHLDSYRNLQVKLDQTPGDLMKLFLHLFQGISPADRTRAYQLLLLVADQDSSRRGINPIMVSWIDDLQDANFPYNVPRVAYTDEEVARLINYVERQLKLTCNGLLEMGPPLGYFTPADVYFQHSIRFHHRLARDFLMQPETVSTMQAHLDEKTITSADMLRLLLAEIKFARTYYSALKSQNHPLQEQFFDLCWDARKSPRVLEECERILQQYREEPYSIPDMIFDSTLPGLVRGKPDDNDGIICWGGEYNMDDHFFARPATGPDDALQDISWIHFLAHITAVPDSIMDRITPGLMGSSSSDLCLVLSASLSGENSGLLERLLDYGLQLSDQVELHPWQPLDGMKCIPGWVVFLALLGSSSAKPREQFRNGYLHSLYASLESLLLRRRGSDVDVRMEFQSRQKKYTAYPRTEDSGLHDVFELTLEQLVLHVRPPNMDSLLREIQARKTWKGWAVHLANRTLSYSGLPPGCKLTPKRSSQSLLHRY